jgi:hypothetical protein
MTDWGAHDEIRTNRDRRGMRPSFPRLQTLLLASVLAFTDLAAQAQSTEPGFFPLFDGESLKGWHVSAKTGHSRASKNQSGGKWAVENDAMLVPRTSRVTAESSSPTKPSGISKSRSR